MNETLPRILIEVQKGRVVRVACDHLSEVCVLVDAGMALSLSARFKPEDLRYFRPSIKESKP